MWPAMGCGRVSAGFGMRGSIFCLSVCYLGCAELDRISKGCWKASLAFLACGSAVLLGAKLPGWQTWKVSLSKSDKHTCPCICVCICTHMSMCVVRHTSISLSLSLLMIDKKISICIQVTFEGGAHLDFGNNPQ